jgi:hypothetical protein
LLGTPRRTRYQDRAQVKPPAPHSVLGDITQASLSRWSNLTMTLQAQPDCIFQQTEQNGKVPLSHYSMTARLSCIVKAISNRSLYLARTGGQLPLDRPEDGLTGVTAADHRSSLFGRTFEKSSVSASLQIKSLRRAIRSMCTWVLGVGI